MSELYPGPDYENPKPPTNAEIDLARMEDALRSGEWNKGGFAPNPRPNDIYTPKEREELLDQTKEHTAGMDWARHLIYTAITTPNEEVAINDLRAARKMYREAAKEQGDDNREQRIKSKEAAIEKLEEEIRGLKENK